MTAVPVRVIGVGNSLRGDDAAGIAAARLLRDRLAGRAEVIEAESGGPALLDLVAGARAVILIDAARSGAPPGTVARIDLARDRFRTDACRSTHGLGVEEAIELARALGRLPERAIVFAIEVAAAEPGKPLSPAVAAAVGGVLDRIADEVEACRRRGSRGAALARRTDRRPSA